MAQLEQANLNWARLSGANLNLARLSGADLRYADLRRSQWSGTPQFTSPAHFADLRGARSLTQAQLDQLIGNEETLLPLTPADTGDPFFIWSCWKTPPTGLGVILLVAGPFASDVDRAALRAEFLCGPGNPRRKTGTPWPLDKPRPEGHPLGPD
jgi:hypothetical protein